MLRTTNTGSRSQRYYDLQVNPNERIYNLGVKPVT